MSICKQLTLYKYQNVMGNEINMVFFGCIHLARQFRFGSVRWIQLIIAAIMETELSKLRFSDQMIDMTEWE